MQDMQLCQIPDPLAQNPFPAPNSTPGGNSAWGLRGGDDSCQEPQPAGKRLKMEQGCLGWALGRCPNTPAAPLGPYAAITLQIRSGPDPQLKATERHTFSSTKNQRRVELGLLLAYSMGFGSGALMRDLSCFLAPRPLC